VELVTCPGRAVAGGFFSKIVAEHVRAFWNANIMMHDVGGQRVSLISDLMRRGRTTMHENRSVRR
jgi:hypothetical protein